jgi:glutamate dehydrogenase/leucine dehydrogenase
MIDTTLGPALGGSRMWKYENEEMAIQDALRLARGMTYKNAAAGLNLGGGKTVIIGDPKKDKSEELFRALGRYIQGLNGRYITAEDVGTTESDMDLIHMETDYVINAGGVINIADELQGEYNKNRAMKTVETIYDNVMKVLEISNRDGIPTYLAADRMAEDRIEKARRSLQSKFLLNPVSVLNRK